MVKFRRPPGQRRGDDIGLDAYRALRRAGLSPPPGAPDYLETVAVMSDALDFVKELLPEEHHRDPERVEAALRWATASPPRGRYHPVLVEENGKARLDMRVLLRDQLPDFEQEGEPEALEGEQEDDRHWLAEVEAEDRARQSETPEQQHQRVQQEKQRNIRHGTVIRAPGDPYKDWRPRPS